MSDHDLWSFINTYWEKPLDYYTQFPDKRIFWSSNQKAYISYRKYGAFCVILWTSIGISNADKSQCYEEFFALMRKKKTIVTHYRVSQEEILPSVKKKKLAQVAIWEEWIIDLTTFNLQTPLYKNLRNTFNKCLRNGYKVKFLHAPYTQNIQDILFSISQERLRKKHKKELWFSQWYLQSDTIDIYKNIALLYDVSGNIIWFNTFFILWNTCAYDLMRYKNWVSNGVVDFFLTSIILHAQELWYAAFSLGLTPMCFSKKQKNIFSKALAFIGKTFNNIHHYQDLRYFKQKYHPERHTRYFLCKKRYIIPFSLILRQTMRVKKVKTYTTNL